MSAISAAAPVPEPEFRVQRWLVAPVALLLLIAIAWFVATLPPARPPNVPRNAVWIDHVWISCRYSGSGNDWECLVHNEYGVLLHAGIYRIRGPHSPQIIGYRDDGLVAVSGGLLLMNEPAIETVPAPTRSAVTVPVTIEVDSGGSRGIWPMINGRRVSYSSVLQEVRQ